MTIVLERAPSALQAARPANWVLAALSEREAPALASHLEAVELPARRTLERCGKFIEHVYFLDRGVAALSVDMKNLRPVSVGLIGREGLVGVARASGLRCSQWDTQMHVAGAGVRMCADAFERLLTDNPNLRTRVLRFAHALTLQAMSTARANARATLEERLVRWMLMVHDRSDGDEIQLTHEALSAMLGARRAGVSVAAKHLERQGMIALHRGSATVLDRSALESYCGGAYGAPERQSLDAANLEAARE
jgi:CRP-like cAMP-binding protein